MKMGIWKFCIPAVITTGFVVFSETGHFYLILIMLFVSNIFNWIWGEFEACEVQGELRQFYRSGAVLFIKRISAIGYVGFILWGIFFVEKSNFSIGQVVIFGIATGFFSGCFMVTLAHDMLHSGRKLDTYLSSILLVTACIPYFSFDHVFGHHKNVGLENDKSTAKLNQSFYQFFLLNLWYRIKESYVSQFQLPNYIRLKILRTNIFLAFVWILVCLAILVIASKPIHALSFFLLQGFTAYFLYELINYIQHYGLVRTNTDMPISLHLSWNCYYKYTNYVLYMLPLHSLHHLPPKARKLSRLEKGPEMPYLYFVMIFMALFPSFWFEKMNPLVFKVIGSNEKI